ncbi:site-specific integrase [Salmonella enterica subsp. enterica serovar Javiana]|uniref:Site-specific integrase n=1 Tax=Salmonella enterica subsp. enterica serovar Javiana TaxID=363569 RepID=A0A5I1MUW1_SALET|nr:site-specific integrase [Salmonella enterica]EBW8004085.1 site-specific integrase [Salmonella enterica subsp. enterica serovar Javiana]ECH9315490.1 site-specific integrase [Salmonella enterica subsp. enterica]EDX8750840.1 site-specific integrase [Salmonella enterica subsp. enterica serovar 4,[5],12:b:-]EAM1899482.1 site-specific integrase [Salmonella enterica]
MTDNRGIRASQQGELNCLCGAYCVVNMLSWLYDGRVKRRPLITRLLEQGVDINTVRKLAGHSDISTTTRYDYRGEGMKAKASQSLRCW